MNIEQTDRLHDIIHLISVKLEEANQKIGHQWLIFTLFQLKQLVLVLHVCHYHQNQRVGTYSSLIWRGKSRDIYELFQDECERFEWRVQICINEELLRYSLINLTDYRPLCYSVFLVMSIFL